MHTHLTTNYPARNPAPWLSAYQTLAETIAKALGPLEGESAFTTAAQRLITDIRAVLSESGFDSKRASRLRKTVAAGVAFHHGGLTMDTRSLLEDAYRQGTLRVLVATTTLSSGVNLPANLVIIVGTDFGARGHMLTSRQYQQMIGRAGRLGQGREGHGTPPAGQSMLLCTAAQRELGFRLLGGGLEPVYSALMTGAGGSALQRAILELVVNLLATAVEDIESSWIKCTLLGTELMLDCEEQQQGQQERHIKENEPQAIMATALASTLRADNAKVAAQPDETPPVKRARDLDALVGEAVAFLRSEEFIEPVSVTMQLVPTKLGQVRIFNHPHIAKLSHELPQFWLA